MVHDFKKRFWICLVLTLPILLLSPVIQSFFKLYIIFKGAKYTSLFFATLIYFYGGYPFFKGFINESKKLRPGMMTLVSLAITVAYFYSVWVVFGLAGKMFFLGAGKMIFWELATLIDVMLFGHWIEMKSVMSASGALEKLVELMPNQAHLILPDGSMKDVHIDKLKMDDTVFVKAGEKMPVDGVIIEGESEVNEAFITGESKPVYKAKGMEVIGGSVNGVGGLTVKVSKTGADSYISQMVGLVQSSMQSKSRAQDISSYAAAILTLIAIIAGGLTFITWYVYGQGLAFSMERTVSVMVITCPHALGLAVPLVIMVITGIAAKNGLVIKNRIAFEEAKDIDIVVFDKTGTLTSGKFSVTDIIPFDDWTEDKLLLYAAAIEQNSEHSLARAIVEKAKNLQLPEVDNSKAIPGKGTSGTINNINILIGNERLVEITPEIKLKSDKIASEGKTAIFIATDKVIGIIGLSDTIRPESLEACNKLKSMDIELALITGDNQYTANSVGKQLGIKTILSEVLPENKADEIKKLQKNNNKVAMVGDGINDAPALVQADVGIAIGAGTDIAIESADVILVKNNPENVIDIIKLSKITRNKMIQNLIWATGYNVIAIPMAAGVFYHWGIVLPPALGALIMSISTIVVAINSRLVRY